MIRGLSDYKKADDGKKSKKTTSYAGGEKSGLVVENGEDIEGIVAKAKEASKARKERGETKEEKKDEVRTEIRIKLYQNGFVVDDGPFRPYDTPENKEFMKELNEGYVPKEIQKTTKGKVGIGLEDRRDEVYRPPTPPKYVAYSGSGQTIGGVQGKGLEVRKDAGGIPVVDESKPKTTI
jgi:UBX domain-containing protein 1